jgi:hypothetical protein
MFNYVLQYVYFMSDPCAQVELYNSTYLSNNRIYERE